MAIVKISELKDRIGTVIPSISGMIVSVFPSKSGKGQHGEWKLQNIQIEDETGKAQVTLSGMPQDLSEQHKGKNIEFISTGTKYGLKGVSVEEREWKDKQGNDKKTIGVKITKTAQVKLEGAGVVQDHPQDDIPFEFPNATPKNKVHTDIRIIQPSGPSGNTSNTSNTGKTPEQRIAQFGKLYKLSLQEAFLVNPEWEPELIKDIASCFFIQSVREGLADKMDTGMDKTALAEMAEAMGDKDGDPF